MTYLQKIKISRKKSRSFFRYCVEENKKKIRKKPRSKIDIAALMPLYKNREKIYKIARGDSFLV